ncbi:unnamed protein product [Toxocara canis]|uniref:Transcription termination factor Rho n=1 Tax=Toxocara canis TaxID=6265 RepID=A0A183U264_TOXCA|nr:unnamed protein product [Toxocara canis]
MFFQDMAISQQQSTAVFEGIQVKGEQSGIHSSAPISAADLIESTTQSQNLPDSNLVEPITSPRQHLFDSLIGSAHSQRGNQANSSSQSGTPRCQNGTDSLVESSAFQGQNQAELGDDGRSDGGEELRERLEAEFASLSHEALDEFMREVELAVQQHRRQMAAKAAALISELPATKKRQLLQKLKTHSK